MAVDEIIEHSDRLTAFYQVFNGDTSDISGTAGY
jgi:hypothetical protein